MGQMTFEPRINPHGCPDRCRYRVPRRGELPPQAAEGRADEWMAGCAAYRPLAPMTSFPLSNYMRQVCPIGNF
jgi:hypothetical protein